MGNPDGFSVSTMRVYHALAFSIFPASHFRILQLADRSPFYFSELLYPSDGVHASVTLDLLPGTCSSLLPVQYFPGLPCLCAHFSGIARRLQRDDGAAH